MKFKPILDPFKDHLPENCWIKSNDRKPINDGLSLILARWIEGCHVGETYDYAFLKYKEGKWLLYTAERSHVEVNEPAEWVYLHLAL